MQLVQASEVNRQRAGDAWCCRAPPSPEPAPTTHARHGAPVPLATQVARRRRAVLSQNRHRYEGVVAGDHGRPDAAWDLAFFRLRPGAEYVANVWAGWTTGSTFSDVELVGTFDFSSRYTGIPILDMGQIAFVTMGHGERDSSPKFDVMMFDLADGDQFKGIVAIDHAGYPVWYYNAFEQVMAFDQFPDYSLGINVFDRLLVARRDRAVGRVLVQIRRPLHGPRIQLDADEPRGARFERWRGLLTVHQARVTLCVAPRARGRGRRACEPLTDHLYARPRLPSPLPPARSRALSRARSTSTTWRRRGGSRQGRKDRVGPRRSRGLLESGLPRITDLYNLVDYFDPYRNPVHDPGSYNFVDSLECGGPAPVQTAIDWSHMSAISEHGNLIITSLRNLNTVVAFWRDNDPRAPGLAWVVSSSRSAPSVARCPDAF